MITVEDYEDLLEYTPAEVETEPENTKQEVDSLPLPRKAKYRQFATVTVTKDNCKDWHHYGAPPRLHEIIQFYKEAPYVQELENKQAILSKEYRHKGIGSYTDVVNACYCLAIETAYHELQRSVFAAKDFEQGKDVDDEWIEIILREKAVWQKLHDKSFQNDLLNIWTPEYKRLGDEDFMQTYGQHPLYAEIVDYCQKAAPLAMTQTDEGYNLTSRIKNYLQQWANDDPHIIPYNIIEDALIDEGILPRRDDIEVFNKAKNVLKGIGSTLGLTDPKLHRGKWNLAKLVGE